MSLGTTKSTTCTRTKALSFTKTALSENSRKKTVPSKASTKCSCQKRGAPLRRYKNICQLPNTDTSGSSTSRYVAVSWNSKKPSSYLPNLAKQTWEHWNSSSLSFSSLSDTWLQKNLQEDMDQTSLVSTATFQPISPLNLNGRRTDMCLSSVTVATLSARSRVTKNRGPNAPLCTRRTTRSGCKLCRSYLKMGSNN